MGIVYPKTMLSKPRGMTIGSKLTIQLLDRPPFQAGDGFMQHRVGLKHYGVRIPSLVKCNSGTLLAFATAKTNVNDEHARAIAMRRSTDGGKTWSEWYEVFQIDHTGNSNEDKTGVGCSVVNETTGRVHHVWTTEINDNWEVWSVYSDDDGVTWSVPVNITTDVKVLGASSPAGHTFDWSTTADNWDWYVCGPGNGLWIENGSFPGQSADRIMIPCDHRKTNDTVGDSWSHVIYSDDDGATWTLGGGVDQTVGGNAESNEASVAMMNDGSGIVMLARNVGGSTNPHRTTSTDGGDTWANTTLIGDFSNPSVQGQLVRVDSTTLAYCVCTGSNSLRFKPSIFFSTDDGATWTLKKTLFYHFAGYVSMILRSSSEIMVLAEESYGETITYERFRLCRASIDWLNDATYNPWFLWDFNHEPVGELYPMPETTGLAGGAYVYDYGPHKFHAQCDKQAAFEHVTQGASGITLSANSDNIRFGGVNARPFTFENNSDEFTIEGEVTIPSATTDGVIFSTNAGSTFGLSLEIATSDLKFVLGSSTTVTITSDSNVPKDTPFHFAIVKRDSPTAQVEMYIDGIEAATAVADTTSSHFGGGESFLGQHTNDTGDLVGDIHWFKLTHAALALADHESLGRTKNSIATARSITIPTAPSGNSPSSYTGLQLWKSALAWTKGYFSRANSSGTNRTIPLRNPQPVQIGDPVGYSHDQSSNDARFSSGTDFVGAMWDKDSVVGLHHGHGFGEVISGSVGAFDTAIEGGTVQDYDFCQNTGVFTGVGIVRIDDLNTGTGGLILGTNAETSANAGVNVARSGANVAMGIAGGGSWLLNESKAPTPAWTEGQWMFIGVVGRGEGNPFDLYTAKIDGTSQTLTKVQTTATVASLAAQPFASTLSLAIGHRAGASTQGQLVGGSLDVLLYDESRSDAEMQAIYDWYVDNLDPGTDWSPSSLPAAKMLTWLRADSNSAIGDGNPITTWTSRDAGAYAFTKAGANGPVYNAADSDFNDQDSVTFTEADNRLQNSADIYNGVADAELWVVGKLDADPPVDGVGGCWNFGSASDSSHLPFTDSVIYDGFASTARKNTGNPSASLTTKFLYNAISTANEWTARINGDQHFSVAINTVGWDSTVTVGGNTASQWMNGKIAELIVTKHLSPSERLKMQSYFRRRYGFGNTIDVHDVNCIRDPIGGTPNLVMWLRANAEDVDASSDTDPVGSWTSREGNAYAFTQATASKKPVWNASDANFNNHPSITFDGTDDLLVHAAAVLAGTEGRIFVVHRMTATVQDEQGLLSSSDEATAALHYLLCRPYMNSGVPNMRIEQKDNDTADYVRGNTTTAAGATYIQMFGSTGSAYRMRHNGTVQTNTVQLGADTGDWFGDVANRDNVVVGAMKFTSEANFYKGEIAEIIVYDRALTVAEEDAIGAELATRYGGTWTP